MGRSGLPAPGRHGVLDQRAHEGMPVVTPPDASAQVPPGTSVRAASPKGDASDRAASQSFRARLRGAWLPLLWPLRPTPPALPVPLAAVLVVVALATGASVELLRVTGPSATRSVFAEDAAFLRDARALPLHQSLLQPYNGYLQLLPRLVALPERWLPLESAAWLFAAGAAMVVSCLALVVFAATAGTMRSVALRAVLASLWVLLPAAWWETLDFSANGIWYLIPTCFWVLLWRPATRRGLTVGCVVAFLTVSSNLLAVVLLPLALMRLLVLPRGREWAIPMALTGGALLQGIVALRAPARNSFPLHPSPSALLESYFTRAYLLLPGESIASSAFGLLGLGAVAIAVVVVVAALAVELGRPHVSLVAASAVCTGGVLLVAASWSSWLPSMAPGADDPGVTTSSRYAVPTALLTLSALVLAADRRPWARGQTMPVPRLIRLAALGGLTVVGITLTLGVVLDFRGFPARRDYFRDWAAGVAAARAACSSGASSVKLLATPENFSPYLTCKQLAG